MPRRSIAMILMRFILNRPSLRVQDAVVTKALAQACRLFFVSWHFERNRDVTSMEPLQGVQERIAGSP
jgi:hypothetical protein